MGSQRHDDRSSRMGNRHDPRVHDDPRGGAPRSNELERGAPSRVFDRTEDMGGSGWSGASGRGGMSYEGSGYAASNRGYGREGGFAGERGYGHEHGHEGGYPGDRRTTNDDPQHGFPDDRRFGHGHEGSSVGPYESGASGSRRDDAGFIQERGFGHVPGQRWSGGYGGDRDRVGFDAVGPSSGRGFTGNDFGGGVGGHERQRDERERDTGGRDFGGLPRQRDRQLGAPAEMSREQRHFGTSVDRGGRMGPGASYGYRGIDVATGAPDPDRGPHWGKGPKGYTRTDEKTREDVCEAIAHQGHIDASEVEVKVENGIVILSGTVAHRHQKRALERLVEHVRGVHDVHNELRLTRNVTRESSGQGAQGTHGNGHDQPKNGKIARA